MQRRVSLKAYYGLKTNSAIIKNPDRGVSPIDLAFAMYNHSSEYKSVLQHEISHGAIKVKYVSKDDDVEERYTLNQRERFTDVQPNVIDENHIEYINCSKKSIGNISK